MWAAIPAVTVADLALGGIITPHIEYFFLHILSKAKRDFIKKNIPHYVFFFCVSVCVGLVKLSWAG